MAAAKYNINELFGQAFGLYAKIPVYPTAAAHSKDGEYEPAASRIAPTGVVMWDRFSFSFPTENEDADTSITAWFLPHTTVVDLSRAKNIVKTIMQGKDGSVKEFISMDDWQITLRGLIIDYENDKYPIDIIKKMKDIFKKNIAIKATSKLLNDLEIFDVVVTDLKFPPLEGYQNVAPFELALLSDEPIELIIE